MLETIERFSHYLMKNNPLLSIIIVNYNTKDLLQQCLNSLFKAVTDRSPASAPPTQRRSGSDAWLPSPRLVNMEIIIIDNNSHDGSREFLKELNSKSQTPNSKPQFLPRHAKVSLRHPALSQERVGSSGGGKLTTMVAHPAEDAEPPPTDVGGNQHDVLFRHPEFTRPAPEGAKGPGVSGSSGGGAPRMIIRRTPEMLKKFQHDDESRNNQHNDIFSIPQGITIKTIFNKTNLGFAKAVNQGAEAARGDYLLVLNDDVLLADNWLANLGPVLLEYRKQRIAAFGGVVLDRTGRRVESLGLRYFLGGRAENIANGLKWPETWQKFRAWLEKPHPVDGLNGAAVVYRRDAFLAVGGFDERFFAYLEDVDLALRLREKGWKMSFVPQLVAYHQGGATSQKMGNLRQRMTVRNWWWLIIKNYPGQVWRRCWWPILLERGRNFSYLLRTTPLKLWPATFWWLVKNLLELPTIWRTRKPLSWLAKK